MSKKDLALKQALEQITTAFGKGSIMWLGRSVSHKEVPVVFTGSFALDIALGIDGLPKQIHTLNMSLNFSGIEIETINSLESWSGGVLVVVSGSVKSKEFSGWRKFMHADLSPCSPKDGYFVLNDIFYFPSEEVIHQHPAPMLSENRTDYQQQTPIFSDNRVDYQHPGSTLQEDRIDYQHPTPAYLENRVDSQLNNSSRLSESPDVPDYEVEVSEHFNSVHIEGDEPADEYSLHDQQQQEEPAELDFLWPCRLKN